MLILEHDLEKKVIILFWESSVHILLYLAHIPCTNLKNIVLDIFGNCCHQMKITVIFWVKCWKISKCFANANFWQLLTLWLHLSDTLTLSQMLAALSLNQFLKFVEAQSSELSKRKCMLLFFVFVDVHKWKFPPIHPLTILLSIHILPEYWFFFFFFSTSLPPSCVNVIDGWALTQNFCNCLNMNYFVLYITFESNENILIGIY